MITSYARGWKIIYKGKWIYVDTGEDFSDKRPCKRCGRFPTKDGYDACLDYVPGCQSVCCGHGVGEEIYMRKTDE